MKIRIIKNQKFILKYDDQKRTKIRSRQIKNEIILQNSVLQAHAFKRVIEFILSKNDNVSWFPNFIFVYANNDMI
jgi:hypothetical protein